MSQVTERKRRLQREKLSRYYAVYDAWLADTNTCCQQGCAACCTQSVTATTLEAEIILDFLRENRMIQHEMRIAGFNEEPMHIPQVSTNQFARMCLEKNCAELDEESWNFQPCPFLKDQCCSIYEVRPFACRSFVSSTPCQELGAAEITPVVVTAATVILQCIEHLDQGRAWGNMIQVLKNLLDPEKGTQCDQKEESVTNLLVAQPLPGLLVPPGEEKEIAGLLRRLKPELEKQDFPLLN